MGIVATLILGWYSDWKTSRRWHVGVLLSFTAIVSGALMLSAPTRAARFAALIMNGIQYSGQTVIFAWANDLIRGDDAKRAVVLASMNMFSTAVYLFWSLLFYNATQAPDWYEGDIAMMAMGGFLLLCTLGTFMLQKRQEQSGGIPGGRHRSCDRDLERKSVGDDEKA